MRNCGLYSFGDYLFCETNQFNSVSLNKIYILLIIESLSTSIPIDN